MEKIAFFRIRNQYPELDLFDAFQVYLKALRSQFVAEVAARSSQKLDDATVARWVGGKQKIRGLGDPETVLWDALVATVDKNDAITCIKELPGKLQCVNRAIRLIKRTDFDGDPDEEAPDLGLTWDCAARKAFLVNPVHAWAEIIFYIVLDRFTN